LSSHTPTSVRTDSAVVGRTVRNFPPRRRGSSWLLLARAFRRARVRLFGFGLLPELEGGGNSAADGVGGNDGVGCALLAIRSPELGRRIRGRLLPLPLVLCTYLRIRRSPLESVSSLRKSLSDTKIPFHRPTFDLLAFLANLAVNERLCLPHFLGVKVKNIHKMGTNLIWGFGCLTNEPTEVKFHEFPGQNVFEKPVWEMAMPGI